MTTKKQRREQTFARNEAAREALRLENLEKLERSRHRSEQRRFEAERAAKKKAAAEKIKAMAKKDEVIPENLAESYRTLKDAADEAARAFGVAAGIIGEDYHTTGEAIDISRGLL